MELLPVDDFQTKLVKLVAARKSVKSYRSDKFPDCIQQGLYLGAFMAAANKPLLKEFNITHILTIATSAPPLFPQDFTYKVVSVSDSEHTNLEQYFDECIDFIDEAINKGGAVLVHCIVGKSRSATIVAAYLMKKNGMTSGETLLFVKSKRPLIRPNSGFLSQLRNFEQSMKIQDKSLVSTTSANEEHEQQSNESIVLSPH